MKVREFTPSQERAVICASNFVKKAKAGKNWQQIVDELSPEFYNPNKTGDAETQIKSALTTSSLIFKATGQYAGHVGQSPTLLDMLNEAKQTVGLGRRGRAAKVVTEADRERIANLLDNFGG